MNPFPYFAMAAALLSGHPVRSQDSYVALAAGDPNRPLLAISARGAVWSIQPATRDTALATHIAISSPFVSITRSKTGGCYALTRSGAIAGDGGSSNDFMAWRDCGLLGGPRAFVALSVSGSTQRLVALSASGELFVAGAGSWNWEFGAQIPDSSGSFVSLGPTQAGGIYALTAGGRVWFNPNACAGGKRWILDGQLPAQCVPYVAIAGSNPIWSLSAAGDLAVRDKETGLWSLCGRLLAAPGEAFTGLCQDEGGTNFALTAGGTIWRALPAPCDRLLWHHYVELPRLTGPESPRESPYLPSLTLTPNPVCGPTAVQLFLPARGFARLELYDIAGRIVRTLLAEDRQLGSATVSWDGALDNGHPAAPGIYFMRLRSGALEAVKRFPVIR